LRAEEAAMSYETTTTVVGNLTADPDLRHTSTGIALATFTVASTARVQDGASGEWRDGATIFLSCSAWRRTADRVARCLAKGDRVVVTGRLRQCVFETDGAKRRSTIELIADEVALSLRSPTLRAVRNGAGDSAQQVGTGAGQPEQADAR
jgi:single-strand DNA-binding protein